MSTIFFGAPYGRDPYLPQIDFGFEKKRSQMNKTRHLVNILKNTKNMYFVVSEGAQRISFTDHAVSVWDQAFKDVAVDF